jgi:hypothetical protein
MSMNGTKVITKFAGTALVGEVSSSQDLAIDLIETTVKGSPERSKTYESGENGMTISCEAKVKQTDGAVIVALFSAAKAGTAQPTIVSSEVQGDIQITGNGLLSGISLSEPQNDVRTVTYSLTFTGEYAASVISA